MKTTFHALLNPFGQEYSLWRELLGTVAVPLKSADTVRLRFDVGEDFLDYYMLDAYALPAPIQARLRNYQAAKFMVSIPVVDDALRRLRGGFPIRASEVVVVKEGVRGKNAREWRMSL